MRHLSFLALTLLLSTLAFGQSSRTVPADSFQVNTTGNNVLLKAPGVTSSYTLNLPTAQASGTAALLNGGTGTLSWLGVATAATPTTLVERDASGNFSAGTITATLSGNATNVTGTVALANGGTGATTAAGARTALGLGTAAVNNVGTAPGNVVQLDGSSKLPAVDGSQLTNVTLSGTVAPTSGGTGTATAPTAGQVLIGTSGGVYTPATVAGTTHEVNVTSASGSVTLSTPQAIDTTSSPTFATLTLGTSAILNGSTSGATTLQAGATASGTLTLPAATDTLVGRATTDTLTNKTLTAPVVSSYQDMTEIATPANPSAGAVRLYSKSGDNLFTLNSSGIETQVGSGSGEKNYVQTGSSTAAGWGVSGAGVTVTTDTNAADLPDVSRGSALLITGVSGSTDYAFQNFTLDPADYNKKLKVQTDQACGLSGAATAIASCASGNFRVDVYSCTVAWSGTPATTCSGTATRLPLSTDSSSVSALPGLTGTYRTTFDSPGAAAKYLQLRVGLNATTAHAVAAANVVVGPGVVVQGAVTTAWQSYTPTFSAGFGTVAGISAAYRRVGDTMEIQITGTTGTTTASAGRVNLPSGYTINFTALGGGTQAIVGTSTAGLSSVSGADNVVYPYVDSANGNNFVSFSGAGDGATHSALYEMNVSLFLGSSKPFSFFAKVPINEWAGSGTVNLAATGTGNAYVKCDTGNGYGSTNTKIRRFTNCTPFGSAISYADSATLGGSFTINEAGVYSISYTDYNTAATAIIGVSVNTTNPTTSIETLSPTEKLTMAAVPVSDYAQVSVTYKANAGDVIRAHTDGGANGSLNRVQFSITKVLNDPTGAVGFTLASSAASGLVSYEDSGTFSTTFSGPCTSGTVNIKYSRVGKNVCLNLPGFSCTSTTSTGFTSAGDLPGPLEPASQSIFNVPVLNSGSTAGGALRLYTSGAISFYASTGFGSFASSGSAGLADGSGDSDQICYTVN